MVCRQKTRTEEGLAPWAFSSKFIFLANPEIPIGDPVLSVKQAPLATRVAADVKHAAAWLQIIRSSTYPRSTLPYHHQ